MELNEIHHDSEHATTSLKVVLLVFALILVGALGYLVWAQNTEPDATDYSAPKTKTTTTTSQAAVDCGDTAYAFDLTLGTAWDGYKIKEVLEADMVPQPGYALVTCYFTLPTTSTETAWQTAEVDHAAKYASVFAVSVYTPAQWTASQEEANKPTELDHNSAYYWGWSPAQALPTDLQASKIADDVANVVATFKIHATE